MPMIPVYMSCVDGLTFERAGRCVAAVLAPDGSSLERCPTMISPMSMVLMVPGMDDPWVRYAWSAGDVIVDSSDPESRFHAIEFSEYPPMRSRNVVI